MWRPRLNNESASRIKRIITCRLPPFSRDVGAWNLGGYWFWSFYGVIYGWSMLPRKIRSVQKYWPWRNIVLIGSFASVFSAHWELFLCQVLFGYDMIQEDAKSSFSIKGSLTLFHPLTISNLQTAATAICTNHMLQVIQHRIDTGQDEQLGRELLMNG